MKTAEDWAREWLGSDFNENSSLVSIFKQIQLDAFKAGMGEAVKTIRKLPIQFCRDLCESAILSARDRKESL